MPVCDNVRNPREEYLRTKTAIYSNGKRQWRVVVTKKINETENYQTRGKLYISFARCVQ
jgi:hypothetical protein